MDEGARDMDQFLANLHSMKAQLVRVKSAATNPATLKVSELEDIRRNIDVLLARLQLSSLDPEVEMTRDEAEALRVKWKDRRLSWPSNPSTRTQQNQELEWREDGHLTRNYCCTDCGELVGKKL